MYTTVHTLTTRATTETSAVSERAQLPFAAREPRRLTLSTRLCRAGHDSRYQPTSLLLLGVKWMAAPTVSGRCPRSADGLERYALLPHLPLPACSALLPSHATLLTINRTRAAGPFDCVIPRSSRVPRLKSPRSQQLQAYARVCQLAPVFSIFFSPHRLPPRQSGTAWPGLSAGLLLGPSSSVPILSAPTICLRSGVRPWAVVQT